MLIKFCEFTVTQLLIQTCKYVVFFLKSTHKDIIQGVLLTVSAAPTISNLSLMAWGSVSDCMCVGVINLLSSKASRTSSGTYKSFHCTISKIVNMNT